MEVQRTTVEEWESSLRDAPSPTTDDVTVTADGRRLDSKEKVLDWLADLGALRCAEAEGRRFDTIEKVSAFLADRQAAREAATRARVGT